MTTGPCAIYMSPSYSGPARVISTTVLGAVSPSGPGAVERRMADLIVDVIDEYDDVSQHVERGVFIYGDTPDDEGDERRFKWDCEQGA